MPAAIVNSMFRVLQATAAAISELFVEVVIAPAIDGLRAFAVGAVLLFHADHMSGGFLGADVRGEGFAFDVPVRFDTDRLPINLANFDAGEIPSIPLIEVRL